MYFENVARGLGGSFDHLRVTVCMLRGYFLIRCLALAAQLAGITYYNASVACFM